MPENKLPKISYLFGAGASAQALPTIKKLPERIKFARDFIDKECVYEENEMFSPTKDYTFKKNDAKQYVLEGLDKLFLQLVTILRLTPMRKNLTLVVILRKLMN